MGDGGMVYGTSSYAYQEPTHAYGKDINQINQTISNALEKLGILVKEIHIHQSADMAAQTVQVQIVGVYYPLKKYEEEEKEEAKAKIQKKLEALAGVETAPNKPLVKSKNEYIPGTGQTMELKEEKPKEEVPSCHMFADTMEELLEMADKIGLKRKWLQEGNSVPHFDLTEKKRKLAVECGAKQLTLHETGDFIRRYKQKQ
jgi:hypothetical protein